VTGFFTTAAMDRDVMKIVSYNLHGLNNGRSCLIDLCNDPDVVIIAVQEHWLPPDKLFLLNEVHPEFSGCGISSMSDKLVRGVFYGRPYGGVGFLWRKKLTGVRIGYEACSGRIMSMMLELNNCRKLNIVSVYFPCFAKSCEYKVALSECLSDLEEIAKEGYEMVIVGDTNFECDLHNDGFVQLYSLLSSYNISHCDDFVTVSNERAVTYVNDALSHCSFIDHMFVSDTVRQHIMSGVIFESGANVSDHLPLIYCFQFGFSIAASKPASPISMNYHSWRWDKADLGCYYNYSYQSLSEVDLPSACDCLIGCRDMSHLQSINVYYEAIVSALLNAAYSSIPGLPCHSLKPFWSEELDRRKADSVFWHWHDMWISAGRPKTGEVQRIRLACKAKYKLSIINAYVEFEDKLSDELRSHFNNKNVPEFWKSWNAKFRKKYQ